MFEGVVIRRRGGNTRATFTVEKGVLWRGYRKDFSP